MTVRNFPAVAGFVATLMMTGLLTGVFSPLPAKASQFASHRATYDLDLRQSENGSNIKGINGRTVFSIERHCDGWQSVEDYAITFSFEEAASNFISHYETWESLSGNAFSFNVVENSNINGPAEYNGFANLSEGSGEAYFLDGDETATPLPDGTKFPVKHLREMLSMAQEGKPFMADRFFSVVKEGIPCSMFPL